MATLEQLRQWNHMQLELSQVYADAALRTGLSESTFWILYSLWDYPDSLTQSDLCRFLSLPKQTVNSAMKKLERDGILTMEPTAGKRGKLLRLTEAGKALSARTVERVTAAEVRAMNSLSEREQRLYFTLQEKLFQATRDEFAGLFPEGGQGA